MDEKNMCDSKSEPIRILQENVIMNPGGIESLLMNLYRHIDRSKVQFDFLLHRKEKGFYDDEILSLGGKIYYADPFNPFHHLKYLKSIDRVLKTNDYKIMHAHTELNYWPLRIAKKNNVPIRIAHSHNAKTKINLKYFFMKYQRLRIGSAANYFFMCSKKAGNWSYGSKKVNSGSCIFLKNGIEVEKFKYNSSVREKKRMELDLKDNIVFLHIGRFMQQKNHSFLIDIFKEIHKVLPKSILLLVSEGRLLENIKIKVEKNNLSDCVRFLGYRDDSNELYQAADVFLLPSLWEGLPFTMIEAQTASLPCYMSDVITDECIVTDLVTKIPLSKKADEWAKIITDDIANHKRKDYSIEIRNAGFDIVETAHYLENFYLNMVKSSNHS